ncbi:LuxR C-terminal-related transcriptional regulator [Actinoplanes sp. NPDC051861]|uniref:LuxR C-terminal-related transcriptional regulator n=1 Tax=Actinoplanes sp. NPDC051861 TaxID=3155170 RepID=UPI003431C88B
MSSTERPATAEPHLVRPRLNALLDESARHAVTLIQAGPGWGKTTLAADWAGGRLHPVAWLTLSRRHATVPAFCSAVAAALKAAFPQPPAAGRFGVSDEAGLRRLTAGFGSAVPMVLDDLHTIAGSPAVRVLAGLVRRRPPGLHLVLISRDTPDLPLHIPRSAGGLTVIGAGDLRFDEPEAAALIPLLAPATDAAALARLAEGWPLALRLAAGQHEAIGDYLAREVIAKQSTAVRRFLMRTSIVEEVSPGLADALTGSTGSRRILAALDRSTGLLSGDRYHGELRAEARRMLEREAPDQVTELHARAARWYAGRHMAAEALRHAADAEDWDFVSHLVVTLAPGLSLSAYRPVFAGALRRIPPELMLTTPEFIVCAAMLVGFDGDFQEVGILVERARQLLAGRPGTEHLAVASMLDVFEAGAVMRMTGDMPALVAATTRILDRMRDTDPRVLPIAPQIAAVAKIMKGMGLIWTLQIEDAYRHLRDGMAEARELGMPLTAANAEGHLALLAYFDGFLSEAERLACASFQQAEELGATGTVQATAAYLALALVEVERDRLAEAQTLLRNVRRSEADPPEATFAVVAMLIRVHMALAAGDHAAATSALRQARAEAVPSLRAPLIARWFDGVQCEIDLLAAAPARVVERLGDATALSPHEMVVLGRARLALGDQEGGEELLTRATIGTGPLGAVSAWIVLALSAEARGDTARAKVAAARAAALAEPEGITRHFRVLGAEHLRNPKPEQTLPEPLSERELEVLRFLPTVLAAHEIADELGISVNTVKAHMRSIYRKLGVARRREAVIRAGELDLIQ